MSIMTKELSQDSPVRPVVTVAELIEELTDYEVKGANWAWLGKIVKIYGLPTVLTSVRDMATWDNLEKYFPYFLRCLDTNCKKLIIPHDTDATKAIDNLLKGK